MTAEYHRTSHLDRWLSVAANWVSCLVFLVAVGLIYAIVAVYADNKAQREEINAFKARGCPASWKSRPFLYSTEEDVVILRPGTVRIACYYKKGVGA